MGPETTNLLRTLSGCQGCSAAFFYIKFPNVFFLLPQEILSDLDVFTIYEPRGYRVLRFLCGSFNCCLNSTTPHLLKFDVFDNKIGRKIMFYFKKKRLRRETNLFIVLFESMKCSDRTMVPSQRFPFTFDSTVKYDVPGNFS